MQVKDKIIKTIGLLGAVFCIIIFIRTPSFPTPDKLLIFGAFVAMIFGQARELLRRFIPFVAMLLIYESFRGIAEHLNTHVTYGFMPAADRLMFFGQLPSFWLQGILWHGRVMWYDMIFYLAYMLHFVLPLALAVAIWKLKEKEYWRYVLAFVTVSFMGFLTFVAFPAAPPWMASDKGLIEPITRVSSHVWYSLGIEDFPSFYNKISPNPVAAVPSLHAAYAVLFALFITKLFESKWRWLAWVYPILIWMGTVYQGEHYVIDLIIGGIYAVVGYIVSPYILKALIIVWRKLSRSNLTESNRLR